MILLQYHGPNTTTRSKNVPMNPIV